MKFKVVKGELPEGLTLREDGESLSFRPKNHDPSYMGIIKEYGVCRFVIDLICVTISLGLVVAAPGLINLIFGV